MPDDDPTPDPAPKPDDKPDPQDEIDKWKALARKHEAQAKSNAEAAKKLAEMEDAGRSELEKAAAKVAEAEKRAAEADARALRLEVAATKGLSPVQARRLVGATKEELEADADELLESFKPADDGDQPKPPTKPTENLKGGGDPSAAPEPDIRKVVADIPRSGF